MLEQLLAIDIYHFGMVMTRLSGAFLLLPGFSANYVPPRIRLFIALGVTVAMLPVVMESLPPQPPTIGSLFLLLAHEMTVGVFMGAIAQTLLASLHFAGAVVALSAGLSNAFIFDPVSESQGAVVTGLFNLVALVTVFVTGTHILMLEAVMSTYTLFPPDQALIFGDMGNYLADTLAKSFHVGLQLAAPFVVFSLVFQTSMGVTSRLNPQLNVYFVALPLQIILALSLMSIVLPTIMLWAINHYETGLRNFIAGG